MKLMFGFIFLSVSHKGPKWALMDRHPQVLLKRKQITKDQRMVTHLLLQYVHSLTKYSTANNAI